MAQWQKRSETQEEFCFTFLKLESKSIITEDHFTYETSKHQTSTLKSPIFCRVLLIQISRFSNSLLSERRLQAVFLQSVFRVHLIALVLVYGVLHKQKMIKTHLLNGNNCCSCQ